MSECSNVFLSVPGVTNVFIGDPISSRCSIMFPGVPMCFTVFL